MSTKLIKEKFQHQITIGNNSILSDADKAAGGNEEGMTPHEILEASLASCVAITLKMYSNVKNFPLEYADVEVTIEKAEKGNVFKKTVKLFGPLNDEQKKRLLEIADRCPVHKILTSPIIIESHLI
jgi:putative redox protein